MADIYIQPSEMTLYYDSRRLLELLSDTNIPADISDLTNVSSSAYLLMYELIRAASSTIDARCQVGRRYSRGDLENIAGDATSATAKKRASVLRQLTADLAWGILIARRGYGAEQMKLLAPRYEEALLILEQLYQGIAIFDLDAPKSAGVPSIVVIGQNRLVSSDFNRMFGLWPDARLGPYSMFGSYRY